MEAYGAILNLVIPVFFFLFFIETLVAWQRGEKVIRGLDSISSFSSGITNVVKDVLGLSVGILSYIWLVDKVALVHVEASWALYAIAFFVVDFQGYWVHRWSHEINFLWNRHIIHHSSEEFNLSCALRQSISTFVNYFTFLLLPAALLGVPGSVIAVIGPLHLFLQYWYHPSLLAKWVGWNMSSLRLHIIAYTMRLMQSIWIKTMDRCLSFGIDGLVLFKKNAPMCHQFMA